MVTNTPMKRSAKAVREDVEERRLRAISKRIDTSKLDLDDVLLVDRFGNVDITPDHPQYKFWTEDD